MRASRSLVVNVLPFVALAPTRTVVVAVWLTGALAVPLSGQNAVADLVDRLMEVSEQNRVHRLREVREKLLQGKFGASPRGVGYADSEAIDFQDLGVRQGVPKIRGVGVAVDYHCAGGFRAHTINDVLPYDVAAVYGDVGTPYGGTNIRVDLVPAV